MAITGGWLTPGPARRCRPAASGRLRLRLLPLAAAAGVAAHLSAIAGEPTTPERAASELICTWTDGPRLSADGLRCEGVVHCRRALGSSVLPYVRRVECAALKGACSAEHCAADSLRRP